ncbi:MAG: DUF3054 domain-containing protein [Chloroflexota bacterium]
METTTTNTSDQSFPWLLLVGDWLVLLLFVFTGQRDHDISGTGALPSLLVTTLSLAIPWTIGSFLLGGYRPQTADGLWPWLGRILTIWLIAAPLGLIIRALVRSQDSIPVTFMLVVLGIGGLFMLVWRGVYWWWRNRKVA